jgi:hypothetical protein
MDELEINEVLMAMIDTIVDTMGDDALEYVKTSLKVSKEIENEGKRPRSAPNLLLT